MITVYEITPDGSPGTSKEIDPREGVSPGWTYTPPPDGQEVYWHGGEWVAGTRRYQPGGGASADSVREDRNSRLTACDWTQYKDIPDVVSSLWAPYRQALRDVPQQDGFPANVAWPDPPT